MPRTHVTIRLLAKEGLLEITQRGLVSDINSEIRGPYRIRKMR